MACFASVDIDDASLRPHPVAGHLLALLAALAAVAVGALAQRYAGLDDLSLVFMLAVLLVAARTRTGPALVAAVACCLGYNFFFIEPHYTLAIASWRGVATMGLFLAAAVIAGRLASRLAMQVAALRRAHAFALARQALSSRFAQAASEADATQAAIDTLRDTLDAQTWIRTDLGDAHAHAGTEDHGWWFLPLRVDGAAAGSIGLKLPAHRHAFDAAQRALAQAVADELAQTLHRLRLQAALQAQRVAGEGERLRTALFASLSHDLRTPLAGILGAAGSLKAYDTSIPAEDRRALLDTLHEEGERLDRYIGNLLDMTKLEHGGLVLHRTPIGIDDLVGGAVARARRLHPAVVFDTTFDDDVAPLHVQASLVEQALFNVLDNAARHSLPGGTVAVRARHDGDEVVIDVIDHGPGIPPHERERIFDPFHRIERTDRTRPGTGLGLAITRGMIDAHGGRVEALARDDGAHLRITLPRALQ